ncbi:MAG: adenosylmethionine decarboxylase [Colwellia sp.]|nr:adenosylmethionine decarboxylase [Colwellia sp.]
MMKKDDGLFFEGSEKKAQIIINAEKLSLLTDIDNNFWEALVKSCGAKILSSMTNNSCKALLLSESSLFIWHHKLLIITCGTSQLVKAIEFFIDSYPINTIKQISYQRKNEYFSHAQPSCFSQDVKTLRQYISGKAYRFGDLDSHHNYLFHQDNNYQTNINDKSYEIVAYHISEAASKILTDTNLTALNIRNMFNIDKLFAHFDIDDHVFHPFGYSLNGIHNEQFFTIHITPQAESSYISISANFDLISLLPHLITILAPTTIDILTSNELNFEEKIKNKLPKQFICTSLVKASLSIGEKIVFSSYSQNTRHSCDAINLKMYNEVHSL